MYETKPPTGESLRDRMVTLVEAVQERREEQRLLRIQQYRDKIVKRLTDLAELKAAGGERSVTVTYRDGGWGSAQYVNEKFIGGPIDEFTEAFRLAEEHFANEGMDTDSGLSQSLRRVGYEGSDDFRTADIYSLTISWS
ncbi:MAG TPA: hypothetical protein VL989_00195 [Candidatus Sulfotelmatobacter sp.]|nr:hypothetical protein [Candidatus Sulfotelmatobacter sp.]